MINILFFILGLAIGICFMSTVMLIKRATVLREWHLIGHQIQYMERINLKVNDGGRLTSTISDN